MGRRTRTDTHNGRNQILTANGTAIAHDARGNMTSDGFRTFAYTSDNMMVEGGGASLRYDPLDRLRFVQGGGNEQRAYDGSELIVEYNMYGTAMLRRYVHGPGVDEPLVWYEGSGTTDRRWLTADERGSVIGAFNDARSGLGYVAYDEYGRRQVLGAPGRFGFTGQQWLPEIGMHYFRARIYDPDHRFMQTDRIGYRAGMNLYEPFGSDPVNRRDPTGNRPTGTATEDQLMAVMDELVVTGKRASTNAGNNAPPRTAGVFTPPRAGREAQPGCGTEVFSMAADTGMCGDRPPPVQLAAAQQPRPAQRRAPLTPHRDVNVLYVSRPFLAELPLPS